MTEEIIGLIPAAGEGTRLGLPYPKELTPMIRRDGYKPAAQFAVETLVASGARHIVFVINETKHQLIAHFGDGSRFGCRFSYVVQERTGPRDSARSGGLAHALDAAYHLTRGRTVFFAMADTVLRPTDVFARMLSAAGPNSDLMLGLFLVVHPEKFGMVRYEQNGRVTRVEDKPRNTDLENAWGCIAWRPRFTEHLHVRVAAGDGDFAAIMNAAIADGLQAYGVAPANGVFADMGTFEEILETQAWYQAAGE